MLSEKLNIDAMPKPIKTRTSAFGVGRRESHDLTEFYQNRIYQDIAIAKEIPNETSRIISVPEVGEWANGLYRHSSENMKHVPDNSIALPVTSPPYNTKQGIRR